MHRLEVSVRSACTSSTERVVLLGLLHSSEIDLSLLKFSLPFLFLFKFDLVLPVGKILILKLLFLFVVVRVANLEELLLWR